MDKLNEHLNLLIQDIKNSETYRTYLELEEKLTRYYPELKREIDEFRAQNFLMQQNKNIDLYEEVDAFERKYYQLRKNPLANTYLEAELEVCHMIQEIHFQITRQINVGIPDINV